MKRAGFSYLFFIFSALAGFSQSNDSSKIEKGIFISVGGNVTQYCSDKFFNYLFDKTFIPTNSAYWGPPNSNHSVSKVSSGPFYYTKSYLNPVIHFGLLFNDSYSKKIELNQIIEISYARISGNYSNSVHYAEGGTYAITQWSANVNDTLQSRYNQTVISLGYKFQPTFKKIFFSLGINCSVNLLKVEQQKQEYINGSWGSDVGFGTYSKNNVISDTTFKKTFVNIPLQLGAGVNINIKKIILKPAFYFTYNFMKGYNFYNFSLGALYKF